jgi:DNA modification methylase
MNIEQVPIEQIKPYENNPRKNDKAVKSVACSIKEFGFLQPIVIDVNNTIVVGHTRWKAANELKLETIPCLRVEDLNEEQVKAYRLLDNKLNEIAEWDSELLQLELKDFPEYDWKKFDIDFSADLQTFIPKESEDVVPELNNESISDTGEIWLCDKHRVMCGDSTKIEDVNILMNNECASLFVTDPPYGVDYANKNIFLNRIDKGNRIQENILGDSQTPLEMKEFWQKAFIIAHQYTTNDASYYIFGPQGGDLMMMMMSIKDAQWQLKHMIVWVKNNHVLGRCDYHYKHEPIWFGWKEKETHQFFGDTSQVSVWEYDKPLVSKWHPTMKPVALIEHAIKNSSQINDIILDLFLGSGTTLIAAQRLNRTCYGMEIEPKYVDVICQRFYNETGIIPHKESGEEFPVKKVEK